MKYDDKLIPVSEIDTEDYMFRLSPEPDPNSLIAAIQSVGLINPPVLRQKQDFSYRIVCGFRRISACRHLGWHEIDVRLVVGDVSELDLFELAILDNRSHRALSVVEQARGIQKLEPYIPSENRLETMASLLGFPVNKKVFQKIRALGRLPEPVLAGVLNNTLSFEAAVHLCPFSPEEALCFLDLFKGLKLSQNKQIEIITLVQEIAMREDLWIKKVLQSNDIKSVLERPDLNRNEKGSLLRAYLKRRRFPTLAKTQERILKALKALRLNEHVHIIPPPYFEGGPYTLRMTFKNQDDFSKRLKTLDAIAKNPDLKKVLEPFGT